MDRMTIPKLNERLIYREKDCVLFDTEQGKLIELNEIANQLIQYCKENNTVDEMIAKLKLIYDDETEEIFQKVEEFFLKAREVSIVEF